MNTFFSLDPTFDNAPVASVQRRFAGSMISSEHGPMDTRTRNAPAAASALAIGSNGGAEHYTVD
jgi:hypothetical protein